MKRYKVVITASALQDMEELYNYIANELYSPNIAKKIYLKIANAVQSLEFFAERHKVFYSEGSSLIRRMLVGNYSVFYTVQDDYVKVMRVIYSSRDLGERLKGKN